MTPEYSAFWEAYNNLYIGNLTDDELEELGIIFHNTSLEIQKEIRRRGL